MQDGIPLVRNASPATTFSRTRLACSERICCWIKLPSFAIVKLKTLRPRTFFLSPATPLIRTLTCAVRRRHNNLHYVVVFIAKISLFCFFFLHQSQSSIVYTVLWLHHMTPTVLQFYTIRFGCFNLGLSFVFILQFIGTR